MCGQLLVGSGDSGKVSAWGQGLSVHMGAAWDHGGGGTPGLSVGVLGPTQIPAPFTLLVTALPALILIVIPSLSSPVSRRA